MKVSEKIYLIDTKALGFEQAVACYLVKGRKTALIDTGYSSSGETIIKYIRGLNVTKIDYIIPTHVHLDHCGAAWLIAEHFPEAMVLAQERAFKHLVDPTRLLGSAREFYGDEVLKMFGEVRPIPEQKVVKVMDGEILSLGDVELTFIYTPGHAPHQMSVLISDGMVVTADAVPAKYPGKSFIIPTTPPPSFDHIQYVESLRRLGSLEAKTFLTPHFGPTPAGDEWVGKLIEEAKLWYEMGKNVLRNGGGVSMLYQLYIEKLEKEGAELPIYAKNVLKLSAIGLINYLQKAGF